MFNGTMADEQEVLAVCLGRLYLGARQVVRASTRGAVTADPSRMVFHLREKLEGLADDTLADFLAKNREPHPIGPDLDPGGPLTYVDDGEFAHIFRDREGWERFRRTFPESDGTLRFSRVGLNGDVTQALLYAGQQFDWDVGSGGYLLFSRSGGAWRESGGVGKWLS